MTFKLPKKHQTIADKRTGFNEEAVQDFCTAFLYVYEVSLST